MKCRDLKKYVETHPLRDIGVSLLILIRKYNLDNNTFEWEWVNKSVTIENYETVLDGFGKYRIPIRIYEYGLTSAQLKEIPKMLEDGEIPSYGSLYIHSYTPKYGHINHLLYHLEDEDPETNTTSKVIDIAKWMFANAKPCETDDKRIMSSDTYNIVAYDKIAEVIIVKVPFTAKSCETVYTAIIDTKVYDMYLKYTTQAADTLN